MYLPFFSRLEKRAREAGTLICVGIDPRTPDIGTAEALRDLEESAIRTISRTAGSALCFKPNIAFFERHGAGGLAVLERVLKQVPAGIPVLLDAKRGDIGSTAEAYADLCFGVLGADAVTLSGYLGRDSIQPFLEWPDRGVFVLCRTTNPHAAEFQTLEIETDGRRIPLYRQLARVASSWSDSVGLVVAGNDPEALAGVRQDLPHVWFLSPGIGAQGGDPVAAVRAGLRSDGLGMLIAASRSVAEAEDPTAAAEELKNTVNSARDEVFSAGQGRVRNEQRLADDTYNARVPNDRISIDTIPGKVAADKVAADKVAAECSDTSDTNSRDPVTESLSGTRLPEDESKARVLRALVETGSFRVGSFRLKSGAESPFYVDLRRLVSDPRLLREVAGLYAGILSGLKYDRLAGIPAAALPIATAVSLVTGKPMVWPRIPPKPHGTGNRIEGKFAPGDRVVLLDDLITSGTSKLEALEVLRSEGIVVTDLVVLLERGRTGRSDLAAAGVRLHAVAVISELFLVCRELGIIDQDDLARMERYLEEA